MICPACGSSEIDSWRDATPSDPAIAAQSSYRLVRCRRCGSATTLGTESDSFALYEGGSYAPARWSVEPVLEPLRRLADLDRMRFFRDLEPGADVLEVGAGDGRLLAALARRGVRARGIEPAEGAAAVAQRRGVEVTRVPFEEATVDEGSLDAVIFWHSLEHLAAPAPALARAATWLARGGRAVLAVPNLGSLQAQLGGDAWFHQDVPRHRVHLTVAGVEALAWRAGLTVERLSHLLVEQNALGMWQTMLNRLTGPRRLGFHALKRGAGEGDPAVAPLLATATLGLPLIPVAIATEFVAGLVRRGGTIVATARKA